MAGCDAVMVALDRFRAALDELVAVSLGGLDVGELLAVADAMQAGKFPLTSNQSGVRTADNNRLRRNTHELMRHELAQPLRTHRRRDVHRAHHVGDQHGDLLVFGMLGGRCNRGTARVTKSRTLPRFGAARAARDRCGHRARRGLARCIPPPLCCVNSRPIRRLAATSSRLFRRVRWPPLRGGGLPLGPAARAR
jgi:hypothetical protein